MKSSINLLVLWVLSSTSLLAAPATKAPPETAPPATLSVREIRYDGRLSDDEARFIVDVDAEVTGQGEASLKLFEGDVAVLPAKLPDSWRIVREGNRYILVAARPGIVKLKLEIVAKIQRAEPWNQIAFTGPSAAIASVNAHAGGAGMEVQLLSGTLLESAQTNGVSRVRGFLGADQNVSVRWQGKITEVARKVLLTADTAASAQITPTVIKYTTQIRYDIVQGHAAQLTLALPAAQALTRLVGEQIRDWQLKPDGDQQILTVEFIKPIEKEYNLTLYSEQTIESTPAAARLNPPQPLEIGRETGSFTIAAEDTLVEIESLTGLRQVNAAAGALATYRFNGRPFSITLNLKRIEPVIAVTDRVRTRLEETRLVVTHNLALNIEKAGVYAIELSPQPGFAVADVHGPGVEDWKMADGKLRVNFSTRVLGPHTLDVQLERALKNFPDQVFVEPLRLTGAARETAQIGAASAAGIRLKTTELSGVREIPANRLPNRSDELLAFTAEQSDWKLTLASEHLAPRVVAEVFNLVTIGDGLVGGSATIRYGLINQGVQAFKIRLPAQCKNIEFTGPNIRRKELSGDIWTITLQDKVWGGYTLVVTYDYQFDPQGATLPVGGIHTVETERETGSIAVTTAASLKLNVKSLTEPLRRVDESELVAADRALVTRSVLLAYQYTGDQYDLAIEVQRHDELPVLEAVADRTEITSVLTDSGEMLTQASFMVKNNEKQFQKFLLPKDATLWGCYVNGQAAKPERDGGWVLVSLPRDANRDQAFAVDIVYAQTNGMVSSSLALIAPQTDVPNTYAEWQLFVPASQRLSRFGGTMSVAQGTTYSLLDGWRKFLLFYYQVLREAGATLLIIGLLAFLVIAAVISGVRRGASGVITLLVVVAVIAVLAAMMLPALASAKRKAQRISGINNLKQIGIAVKTFSVDNSDRFPTSFEEMKNELGSDKITIDPESGQPYVYLGGGMSESALKPDSVLAYSPIVNGRCSVLFADGSVQQLSGEKFGELSQRGLVQMMSPNEMAQQQQTEAIRRQQFDGRAVQSATAATMSTNSNPAAASADFGMYGSGAIANSSGVVVDTAVTPRPAAPLPLASGIRSIRIEIPRTGNAFLFTKVLNVGNVPLSIQAKMMSLHRFQTLQMMGQVAAFLLGLIVWWWQWQRSPRNTFILTLALAMILASVCSLLIAWRAFHDVLIIGFPCGLLAVISYLVWKYWPRRSEPEAAAADLASSVPPIVTMIALTFALGLTGVSAADSKIGNVSILSASYTGTVNDRVAQLDATLQLSSAKPNEALTIFGNDVAVEQFSVKSGGAKLVRDGKQVVVQIGQRGMATVQLKLLIKLSGDVTKRRLDFGIPPALSSQFALTLDQPDADVDFPTAISFKRSTTSDKTRVEAIIGSGERVELLWTPRVKRAAEVAATVFCQNAALVTFGGGVVNVRAVLDYQVTQGELRQARVRLPAGQRLLRVEGEAIRTWEIKEDAGAQTLVVELLKGISPAYRLTIETEKVLDTLPATVKVETPHALDVKRETGLVALRGNEELNLTVDSTKELQRVDAEEFARVSAQKTDGLISVFRFLKPEFDLNARAEIVRPQIEAVIRNNTRVGAERIALSTMIDYTIKRAGVFTLKVALPADYRVEQVIGNSAPVEQWTERGEGQMRLLEVTLKERTTGTYSLRLQLAKRYAEMPKLVVVEGVYPLDTDKLTGFLSVAAEAGVATKTESFDGLTEIPVTSLPDAATLSGEGSVLAYKFIAAEPKSAPEWKLSVTTETIEPWLRAEIVNSLTVSETLVSGRAMVRYDIANAPVKELHLKIPLSFKNVEITGANIRRRDQTGEDWRVELQSKVRGAYTLTVTWEQPRIGEAKTNSLALTGVSAAGVERETGLLAIAAKPPLQVSEANATDLNRVDTRDFPDWAGRADDTTVLAYRYVRPGYALAVETKRFNEAEVLQALVDGVRLATVVAADGQTMTEMSLELRNNGRQFLEVELPPGASVWSAFVAGQPVRPSKRDGKLLLPLEQSGADDAPVAVTLTYIGTNSFPRTRGDIGLVSPKLDVPLKNARWELFLPPDYDYDDFAGTMKREVGSAPSLLSFGLSEYSQMERGNKAAVKEQVRQEVSKVKMQLSSGNVREATVNYNRNRKFSAGKNSEEDADVKQFEKDLNTAQASNLIVAQNDFAYRNSGQIQDGENQTPIAANNYDSFAAGQQWAKLQQAQEVVAVKVQPLHVNLPMRGLRYSFAQVLQTEVNKPMTIQFQAANTRTGHWLRRATTGAIGFALLWAMVAVVSARKRDETDLR